MKFIASAIITLAAVSAFANQPAKTTTHEATTTTTTAPAAHAPAAPSSVTTKTEKKEMKKEASKADACAKLTDAKAKSDCEKKAVHKM
jgi:hypothetical protein